MKEIQKELTKNIKKGIIQENQQTKQFTIKKISEITSNNIPEKQQKEKDYYEYILDKRTNTKNITEYLVKWKLKPEEKSTWEIKTGHFTEDFYELEEKRSSFETMLQQNDLLLKDCELINYIKNELYQLQIKFNYKKFHPTTIFNQIEIKHGIKISKDMKCLVLKEALAKKGILKTNEFYELSSLSTGKLNQEKYDYINQNILFEKFKNGICELELFKSFYSNNNYYDKLEKSEFSTKKFKYGTDNQLYLVFTG